MTKSKVNLALLLILLAVGLASGQKVAMSGFAIQRSTLFEQVKARKVADPKLTAEQLVGEANTLLASNGLNYTLYFDAATCDKLKRMRDERKDPSATFTIGATLQSVDADQAKLGLPEPQFTSPECGRCFVELPMLEVTDKDFVTVIRGRNIKFTLPSNFQPVEAVLLDPADGTSVKKRWKLPFRSAPVGVSFDEDIIYIGLADPALNDLTLAIFADGVFQFATRQDAENGGTGKAADSPGDNLRKTIKFERWKNTYLISYRPACPR